MSVNEEFDDEQLKYAIALSLRDQASIENDNKPQKQDVPPTEGSPYYLNSLDRKTMEQERLARLAAKRPRVESDEEDVVEIPAPKRRTAPTTRQIVEEVTVPFPEGTVKRTWVRGYDRSGDDIKIEEVLQKDKLLLALFSSFQWDEPWLLSKLDISRTKVLLAAFAPDESQKEVMRSNVPRNIKFCFPAMYGPGSMHSKLQILKYANYLRVVVPSGNLVPYDWGETGVMENMVFLIDLPLKSASDQGQQTTMFLTNMQQYLLAMGVDDGMIASLSKYDFSRTKSLGFVYSIPGGHKGEAFSRIGYSGLSATISGLGLATSDPVEVDVACASLGSLKYDLIQAIYRACQGHDGKKTRERSPAGPPVSNPSDSSGIQRHFRIYFPTHETVTKSRGGQNAAGTICLQQKWWRASTFPTELMHDCVNTRSGLLMHSKLILVRHTSTPNDDTERPVAWAYIGSANLSESAWGRVVKEKGSGQEKMMCRNWECGVVLPVRASGPRNGPINMNVFQGTVPIPMQVPGRRYLQDEHPWFFHRR